MILPSPRDYQQKGIDLTRKAYSDGHRKILFYLATGGGKSVIFIHLVYNLLSKNKPVILVMRRRQLVFQAQKHFAKYGIESSVLMANIKNNPNANLQICSIDTIARLKDIENLKRYYAVIVDEAHDCTSDAYKDFLKEINAELYIGLTASPFPIGKKVHDFWDCCIKPIEIHELVKKGFLTNCSIYNPDELDLSDIKTTGGDYNNKQLGDKMSELEIIGDVVSSYKKFGNNLPAICFAVNKEHSIKLCQEFNEANISAVHCDESSNQKERDNAIKDLKEGKIKILCNVNIFSTGVDIPEAIVGIMARPTKSEVLYIQQIGRLLRPYRRCGKCNSGYDNSEKCPFCGYDKPSYIKKSAIIIDNANNIDRHGHPFKVRYPTLKQEDIKKKKEEEKYEFKTKTCKTCFATFMANLKACPECGNTNEKVQRTIKKKDGTIVPYDEFAMIMKKLNEYEMVKLEKGLKPHFPYFKLYEDFGDLIYEYPDLRIPKFIGRVYKENKEKETGHVYR